MSKENRTRPMGRKGPGLVEKPKNFKEAINLFIKKTR